MWNGLEMADRNEGFADYDFEPPERKKIRGVVYREERRAWLLEGAVTWIKTGLYVLPAMVSAYVAFIQIAKWIH